MMKKQQGVIEIINKSLIISIFKILISISLILFIVFLTNKLKEMSSSNQDFHEIFYGRRYIAVAVFILLTSITKTHLKLKRVKSLKISVLILGSVYMLCLVLYFFNSRPFMDTYIIDPQIYFLIIGGLLAGPICSLIGAK